MDKIFCVSEIIFSINDPRQQIADELRYMKTRPMITNSIISRIILVYYCKCCNLIRYSSRYLFLKASCKKIRIILEISFQKNA